MQMFVFSVYDAAVKAFMQPFFSRSRGEAIRSFSDAVNDEKSNFNRHAADFSLHAFGSFDDNSGAFETRVPERIVSATEVLVDNVFPPDKEIRRAS